RCGQQHAWPAAGDQLQRRPGPGRPGRAGNAVMGAPGALARGSLLAAAMVLAPAAWPQSGKQAAATDSEARISALEARLEVQAGEIQALRDYLRGQRASWKDGAEEGAGSVDDWE